MSDEWFPLYGDELDRYITTLLDEPRGLTTDIERAYRLVRGLERPFRILRYYYPHINSGITNYHVWLNFTGERQKTGIGESLGDALVKAYLLWTYSNP